VQEANDKVVMITGVFQLKFIRQRTKVDHVLAFRIVGLQLLLIWSVYISDRVSDML
jgi:hypothetical protein